MNNSGKKASDFLVLVAHFLLVAGVLPRTGSAAVPEVEDETGFTPIFNGKNLDGFIHDESAWRVEDGVLIGESKKHTFCIWEKEAADFILKVKFHIIRGNSGIQYRSVRKSGYRLIGYQAEISNGRADAGEMYGEGGRGHTLPYCGEYVVIGETDKRTETRKLSDVDWRKSDYLNVGGWNQYTIIAQGNRLRQFINGHQTTELIDNGARARRKGLIGFQIHGSREPMKVEFKDARIKILDAQE